MGMEFVFESSERKMEKKLFGVAAPLLPSWKVAFFFYGTAQTGSIHLYTSSAYTLYTHILRMVGTLAYAYIYIDDFHMLVLVAN